MYFPNTTLTKSVGADTMINDSSKRFTKLDPSLITCGKRAGFSVVLNKERRVLLSVGVKSTSVANSERTFVEFTLRKMDYCQSVHGHSVFRNASTSRRRISQDQCRRANYRLQLSNKWNDRKKLVYFVAIARQVRFF